MTTAADKGLGASFLIGDGASPEVFTSVAEVISIKPPNQTRGTIDATHLASAAQEFIPGLKDGGEISLTVNHLRSNYTALQALYNSEVAKNVRAVYPNTDKFAAAVVATALEPGELTPDGKQTTSMTLKVSGLPTWTAGT